MAHGIASDLFKLFAVKDGVTTATLTGAVTLGDSYASIAKLDPGGANRDVTLEAETSEFKGLVRLIVNAADAAENLVCKDADGNTIGTLNQNEAGLFHNSGSAWSLVCIFSIALS